MTLELNNNILTVGIGDFKIGKGDTKIRTCLGSCIALCLYNKDKKIGGLLHIMLPEAPIDKEVKVAKYADTGTIQFLGAFKKEYNLEEADLEAKIFGGAKMIPSALQDIGLDNAKKIREIMKEKNIKILKEKIGGEKGYRIELDVATGLVKCQIYGGTEEIF